MKKLSIFLLISLLAFSVASPAWAAKKTDKKNQAKTLAELQSEREAELLNTEWEVVYAATDGKKAPAEDVLSFAGGKIAMKSMLDKGFGAVSYTVRAYENSQQGTWETYQQSPDGEKSLSMRGDWSGDNMSGVVSAQFDKGKTVETFNFSTQKKSMLAPDKGSEAASAEKPAPTSPMTALVSKESIPAEIADKTEE